MKKFLSLMLLSLPLLALTACHDDDSLPDVDFDFQIENATRIDGKLYVVQGETMEITSITVTNKDKDKAAMITAANFYWDYYYIGSAIQPPFAFEISIEKDTPVGSHILEMESPLFAEDKEAATAVVVFDVEVVASADDIPGAGTATFTVTPKTSSTGK